jgi:D-beta-D-heptose 7-phosphate kinase/D-beta-D-heptose 1-phosphate adenosyltransferase
MTILVVGNLMLDEYLVGEVTRISPEAPVPVVHLHARSTRPGGAANAAANAAALGATVTLAGIVGPDSEAQQLRNLLADLGIDTAAILTDPNRPTTTKTRVLAQAQQIARIDREVTGPHSATIADRFHRDCLDLVPSARAVLLSDYGKGAITPELAHELLHRGRVCGIPTVVDPKGTDIARYRGATVVKPNLAEAARLLGRELRTNPEVHAAGAELLPRLGPSTALLLTRGSAGMTLFEPNCIPLDIPTQARAVYDVTGAGDTVAATVAVSLAEGWNLPQACHRAALAASVVVGKVGTAVCTRSELDQAARIHNGQTGC